MREVRLPLFIACAAVVSLVGAVTLVPKTGHHPALGPPVASANPAPGNVSRRAAVPSNANIPAGTKPVAVPSSAGTYKNDNMLEVGCLAPQPLATLIESSLGDDETSWVVGQVRVTGRTVLAYPSAGSALRYVYSELSVHIDRVIAGKSMAIADVTAEIPGGVYQEEYRTLTDDAASSSWSTDGMFFGAIYQDPALPAGSYSLQSLPVVDGSIVFSGSGCWEPRGSVTQSTDAHIVVRDGRRHPVRASAVKTLALTQLIHDLK